MFWIDEHITDTTLENMEQALPTRNDDPRVLEDAAQKRQRLRQWMAAQGLETVLITRRDHFAWLTAGGDNRVLHNSEIGVGTLLITRDRQVLLAYSMDAARLFEEQMPGQGYELVSLRWYQGDPQLKALEMARGKIGADTALPGTTDISQALNLLHYPFTLLELQRVRWLARKTGLVLETLAQQVRPGMSEAQIGQQMKAVFTLCGIDLDVLIIGSDARIAQYRHPLPTAKVVEQYALLHPSARRWGLHANVSRSIAFGKPSEAVAQAYTAAATVEARIMALLQPGVRFADILARQKEWYASLGYTGEWEYHFQGGPISYEVVDLTRCTGETAVQENQAFDWFITVTGAKVEELVLLTAGGVELASHAGRWPLRRIETGPAVVAVPDLWVF